MRVTKHNITDKTFWIFYFLCIFGFLTQKKVKIDKKEKHSKLLKTNKNLLKHAIHVTNKAVCAIHK